jgi:pimeloyl-ACP methyl ester carboxylesterase
MATVLPPGPYRNIPLADGQSVPYYIIPFDKKGACVGPATRAHLIESARTAGFTDIVIFSHGWNNDWSVATGRYEHFLKGYMDMRTAHDLPMPAGYKPMLVGVFWPSTALVFGEDEKGPAIAAGDPDAMDQAVAEQLEEVAALAEDLSADDTERLYELAQKVALDPNEALELAEILKQVYAAPEDELGDDAPVTARALVDVWAQAQAAPDDLDDFGTVNGTDSDGPQAAFIGGLLKKLDPRPVIRIATVYKMKDRAGTLGARGVGSLLRDLLTACDARVHLIGHSYGGKIVLSATAAGPLPRPVESMLLLQPAVSHLCFADQVPGTDRAGGYCSVLKQVNKPILSTFSSHDFPLTKTFHLALRRKKDLGEAQIAGAEPPSVYAALGGFGPRGCGERLIDIHALNSAYDLDPDVPIYGLRGDAAISGHGDISSEVTWWALYSLLSR